MSAKHGTVRCYWFGPESSFESGDTRDGCRCVKCVRAYEQTRTLCILMPEVQQ
jgi:hypothetical protein